MSKVVKKIDTLGVTSIDSFKYSIPLDEVDVLNTTLLGHLVKITSDSLTGEIIDETPIQENSLQAKANNYHIHYVIKNYFGKKHLVILINSKILEENYLQGISMLNIHEVYNKLQSHKIVDFHKLEDFLSKGFVSDIDYKKDIEVATHKDFDTITAQLNAIAKVSNKTHEGCNRFAKKDNKGIEFNKREKSTFNKPFLKVYHKGIESLNSKNYGFFNTFLDLEEIRNRVRIEVTVKTKSDIIKNGIKGNSLLEVLKASNKVIDNIINNALDKNLDAPINVKTRTPKNTMTPTEHTQFIAITTFIDYQHMTFERAVEMLIVNIDCRTAKSRMKKHLTDLYNQHIKDLKIETKAQKLEQFFKDIDFMNKYAV